MNTKIIFITVVLSFLAVLGTPSVEAQGACQVTSAEFRTNRVINAYFYLDSDRPFVYIDVETQNCVGQNIEISITELDDDDGLDNIDDDDLNGQIGTLDPCGNNSSCMDNRIIPVTENDFTLALSAGEEECEQDLGADCDYYIRINDNVLGGINDFGALSSTGGTLSYDCEDGCLTPWFYYGILEDSGGSHTGDDDYGVNAPVDENEPGVDAPVDESSTATTTGVPSVIDLGLTNPLAGTIDTLPQLLQKIVYIIIKIAVPLVAMAILYSGFLFVTARGSDDQLKKAKTVFTFAIIGGLILLASWLIAEAIQDALTSINN